MIWKEPWLGQEQDWFLCRFLGRDSDVNIATEHPGFREWKWIEPEAAAGRHRAVQARALCAAAAEFAQHL